MNQAKLFMFRSITFVDLFFNMSSSPHITSHHWLK